MDIIIVMVFLTLSVQTNVVKARSVSTQTNIVAKKGETVTLPCSHEWNLSKKEDREKLDHASWFLTDRDETVASHECPGGYSSCNTSISKRQISLDLDFNNKTANLIIADVGTTDSGIYFCLVVTRYGIIQQSVKLSVSGTDTSIRIHSRDGIPAADPTKVIVTANTTETLTCSSYLKKGLTGTIYWNSDGLDLLEGNQNRLSVSEEEDYLTSSVTLYPTHADDNKWVECGIKESTKSSRRVSLKVQDKNESSILSEALFPINNGTSSPVCFHHGSLDHSNENKTCCQAENIIFLPNILPNRAIGIYCCTQNQCTTLIPFRIGEDNRSDTDHSKSIGHNFTIATVMSISLYVVIGTGIIIIAAVLVWRRRNACKCYHVEHTYCEPPDLPARFTSLPPPPLSWIEYEQEDGNCFTSFDDYNPARDDELQELSTTYSDFEPRSHRSLSRTISTLSRRGLRDSEVAYVNLPIKSVLSRMKAIGWSYF